jgi:predicted TIM-barrel fold metal-dependent hydrolase
MRDGFEVVDCNRHVLEPADLWDRLDTPFRAEVERGSGPFDLKVHGKPVSRGVPSGLAASAFDAAANVADMDRQGVDAAILLPTSAVYAAAASHVNAELAAAMCRAYNDWLAEYLRGGGGRLKGVALLPQQDVSAAADELRRSVRDLGLVAGLFLPNLVVGRKPHNTAYDPLYQAAAELGAPLIVSDAPGVALPEVGADRFDSFFGLKAVAEPFEAEIALASFMGHNVVERFPGLKVGFAGAGAGWLACWLDRLDEHWGSHFGQDAPSFLPPDHLFRTQGFAVCDPWERTLPEVIEETGEDTILWGSRYPLPESAAYLADGTTVILSDPLLTEAQKRKVLAANAHAIFHF